MRKFSFLAVIVASVCLCLSAQAADEPKLNCPVSGHPASKEHAEKYKDGQVYFCCDDCPKEFKENAKKYAAKANAQLAATGQYKEVKCPFSGGKLNPDTKVEVAGVDVTFCCEKCQAKVTKANKDARIKMVFADKVFDKAFVKSKDSAK
jgi:YHS domain-containing protein